MLRDFLVHSDIDILLLQEVNTDNLSFLGPNFNYVVNIGEHQRGTAIVYRNGIHISTQELHPSGRITSITADDTLIINTYLPSGTNKRQERENFIRTELPYFFRHRYHKLIFGGDFNCVLSAKDQSGNYNFSPALDTMVTRLHLKDAWEQKHPSQTNYTFHRQNMASRIDRFYLTQGMIQSVRHISVLPIPFSDHDSVIMKLTTDRALPLYGKGYWKLNSALLNDENTRRNFKKNCIN